MLRPFKAMIKALKLGNERGFTVVEMMVVIGILAILVGIAVSSAAFSVDRAKDTACRANLKVIRQAISDYRLNRGEYPPDLEALVSDGLIKAARFDCPAGGDYEYTGESGEIRCLRSGHENY